MVDSLHLSRSNFHLLLLLFSLQSVPATSQFKGAKQKTFGMNLDRWFPHSSNLIFRQSKISECPQRTLGESGSLTSKVQLNDPLSARGKHIHLFGILVIYTSQESAISVADNSCKTDLLNSIACEKGGNYHIDQLPRILEPLCVKERREI